MADEYKNVERIVAADYATLDANLKSKMWGLDQGTNTAYFRRSDGTMVPYTNKGGAAEFLSMKLTGLTGTGSNVAIDSTGNLYKTAGSEANLTQVLSEGNIAGAQIKSLVDGTDAQDAVTKGQLDGHTNFSDTDFTIYDDDDDTKVASFNMSQVSTGQSISLSVPDVSNSTLTVRADTPSTGALQSYDSFGRMINSNFTVGGSIPDAIVGTTTTLDTKSSYGAEGITIADTSAGGASFPKSIITKNFVYVSTN
jgi:hypothetical protein